MAKNKKLYLEIITVDAKFQTAGFEAQLISIFNGCLWYDYNKGVILEFLGPNLFIYEYHVYYVYYVYGRLFIIVAFRIRF